MDSDDLVHIPVPQYPPFDLRSSLIDKDPVIWVHLLQTYVNLLLVLVDPPDEPLKLSVRTQQQLQYFVKVYLSESAEEASKIFSLGAINPDIKTNSALLRGLVFQLIKTHSIVKLNLTGEAVWDFIGAYVVGNSTTVRSLVDGTFKSKYNDNKKSGNISAIPLVHSHLQSKIAAGKLTQHDLEILSHLLGQSIAVTKAQTINITGAGRNDKKTVNSKSNSTQFAEKFVTSSWIESLEEMYGGGSSVNSKAIEHVMIVSMISLSPAKLAKLVTSMGVNNANGLTLYPLFSSILISDTLHALSPGVREKLPFLSSLTIKEDVRATISNVDEADIDTICDLFPQMTHGQAKTLLLDNDLNVERATNILLELPEIISTIEEFQELNLDDTIEPTASNLARFSNSAKSEVVKRKGPIVSSDELQKKTLSAAIRLMYESDEDEPDDTYDDQEAVPSVEKDGQSRDKASEPRQAIDATSRLLFLEFKINNEALSKTARKSSGRQSLKKATGMSDEQIEGWYRLLLKSPRRFKLLEEDYFYGGNVNRRNKEAAAQVVESSKSPEPKPQSKEQIRRTQKRNEAKKSSQANHNRKSKHDKKTVGTLAGMH